MGCFLGCFGGAKDQKRRKQRNRRASPQSYRQRVQNVQQENLSAAEQAVKEAPTITNLVSEFQEKPEVEEQQLSPSPRKRVTFNSQVTTYEHVSIHESVDSLPENVTANVEKETLEDIKSSSQSHSLSEDDNSVTSSVGSYPPNHRYHNARESDDEADEYGDSDLDDLDDEDEDDEYGDEEEDIDDVWVSSKEVWSESVITTSLESRTGNPSPKAINEEVESPLHKAQILEEVKAVGSKNNARDRSDYINSVLNPVENITQWKTVKSKGTHQLKPQKENLSEAPRISFSSEPTFRKTPSSIKPKSDQENNVDEGIAVDASLSTWLVSPEVTQSKKTIFSGCDSVTQFKKTSFSGCDSFTSGKTMSEGVVNSARSFEDRPILGALTVEELRQISKTSSPRKSPTRSPDDMPIIGSVGTYWSHSGSGTQSGSVSSYKGIPNTTSKYGEDKRVNWHSTPFETRLDRALKHGKAEA